MEKIAGRSLVGGLKRITTRGGGIGRNHSSRALDFFQRTWAAYIPTPISTPIATHNPICSVAAPIAAPIPIPMAIHEATFIDFIAFLYPSLPKAAGFLLSSFPFQVYPERSPIRRVYPSHVEGWFRQSLLCSGPVGEASSGQVRAVRRPGRSTRRRMGPKEAHGSMRRPTLLPSARPLTIEGHQPDVVRWLPAIRWRRSRLIPSPRAEEEVSL